MLSIRKSLAVAAASGILVAGLAGCSHNTAEAPKADDKAATTSTDSDKKDDSNKDSDKKDDSNKDSDKKDDSAGEEEAVGAVKVNARPDECGLQEQAGPEASFGPFTAAVHFFQPGVMFENPASTMHMNKYADSQMHLELDLKANEYATNWGYSVDETPANLPIMYKLSDKDGKELASGMMMEMNAIDGSHYGLNLPKDSIKGPGDYVLTITIYPPKNYDIHQDYITGVPARGWFKPLTVNMPWKITQENLDIVKKNTVEDPMAVPEKCKQYPVKLFEDPEAEKAMHDAEAVAPLPMMGK